MARIRAFGGVGRLEVSRERSDVAVRTMPVSVLNVVSFGAGCCSRVLWRRTTSQRRRRTMMTPLEIKGLT